MAITKVQKVVKEALEGKAFDMEGSISEDLKKGVSTVGSYAEKEGVERDSEKLKLLGKILQTTAR